ncbi:MAG: 16S rRNA (cytidine(1402)-2'-O)-methyltransferase [Thermodesulfobacteriota bacterium]
MSGKLYLVSTPIGNLEDITWRAVRILKEVDLIACEDTRRTKKLLFHYSIKTPLQTYHEHNEARETPVLLKLLDSGKNIALVTDAGTPAVSDPGYRLISASIEQGIEIHPIPGANAAITALVASGLPTSEFAFLGFPPRTKAKKAQFLSSISDYPQTLIFYESPNRTVATLKRMLEVLGDRRCSVCRELTKMFEETLRGMISEVIDELERREVLKGEVTIVVEGTHKNGTDISLEEIQKSLEDLKIRGLSLRDSATTVSKQSGLSRNAVYEMALKVWS